MCSCDHACHFETQFWFCDGKCISKDYPCNGKCNDEMKWACEYECIDKKEPCNESCYYDPFEIDLHRQILKNYDSNEKRYKNIQVYCPETQKCTMVGEETCRFETSFEHDPCHISKEVCNNEQLKNRACGDVNYKTCNGHWFGQCVRKSSFGDKIYDCLDRSDEVKSEKLWLHSSLLSRDARIVGEQPIDFDKFGLEECKNKENGGGLTCKHPINGNEVCIPFEFWCRNIRFDKYISQNMQYYKDCVTIDDYALCGNVTFWNTIDRVNPSCGYACSGFHPGQCVPKSNVCDNDTHQYRLLDKDNCLDKSDEVCEDKGKCHDFGYWFCNDSSQCLHPELLCDGHYNCNDKSDEDPERCGTSDCALQSSASFSCPHRYTGVPICASLCNNVIECVNGVDE